MLQSFKRLLATYLVAKKTHQLAWISSHQHNRISGYKQSQQGIALLTVLLLVVAITVVAGAMLAGQKMSIRQYSLLLTQDQILQDVHAGEQLAAALIAADAKANETDSFLDVWAQPIPPTPYANHSIALTIQDASGRFNINNLYHDGDKDVEAIAVFQRLLSQVGLEPNLAYAVLDWQDPDSETTPEGGAEANDYATGNMSSNMGSSSSSTSNQTVSTMATIGNQPFVTIDELMSVRGFTPEKVRQLRPFITAVPYYLPINVNTADKTVLSAMIDQGSLEQFAAFEQQMQTDPLTSVDQIMQQTPWSLLNKEAVDKIKPLLAVSSHAFYVLIDVMVDDDSTGQTKHRYATAFVSKNVDGAQEESQSQTTQTTPAEPTLNNIQPFGTRLWTYRPAF